MLQCRTKEVYVHLGSAVDSIVKSEPRVKESVLLLTQSKRKEEGVISVDKV